MKCPKCEGTGKITVTMTMGWPGQKDAPTSSSEIGCVHCDGTGEVSQQELDVIEFEKNMWCECESDNDPYYVPDNKHKDVAKHHWRCKDCDKVAQIG